MATQIGSFSRPSAYRHHSRTILDNDEGHAYAPTARRLGNGHTWYSGPLLEENGYMTKAELVDQVAETVQLPKHQIEAVLTRCLQGIMDALQAGDKVELRGFGSFRLRHRQAREG